MATDVDTLLMAASSAAQRGGQSSKVGRLWHYRHPRIMVSKEGRKREAE